MRASASGARMATMSPTNTLQGDKLHWLKFVFFVKYIQGLHGDQGIGPKVLQSPRAYQESTMAVPMRDIIV